MPFIAAAVVAVFALILGFAHVNYGLCDNALCKKQARTEIRLKTEEREFALKRKAAEADTRFAQELKDRDAASVARVNDSEARKLEAQAKVDREQALEMARIAAAAQAEARKDAIAAAKASAEIERTRSYRRPEPMHITNYMVERGMGQPRRVHRRMPRQPRYGLAVTCGYPGGPQRQCGGR